MRRRWVLVCTAALLLLFGLYAVRSLLAPRAHGDLALARSAKPGLRVLFVGNSLTYRNDLPALVHGLAEPAHPIFAVSYTASGWRLRRAARNRGLDELLHEVPWDVVVLQEQSKIPSLSAEERSREFEPYVRELDRKIHSSGAETLLFLTWGYAGDGYDAMQKRLTAGYGAVASQLHARIAPIGTAWAEALRRRPGLPLWAGDGLHPSRLGSYLAACVFYAALTGRDPRTAHFTAGLDRADARFAQRVAWDVVLGSDP